MSFLIKNKCFSQLIFKRLLLGTNQSFNMKSLKYISNSNEESVQQKSEKLNKNNLKDRIYSYLYIDRRIATVVYNVLQPKYDSNYLNKILDNLNDIKLICDKRGIEFEFNSNQIIIDLRKLIDLKKVLEPKVLVKQKLVHKINSKKKKKKPISEEMNNELKQINEEIKEISEELCDLEETVMKFVINIPNDIKISENSDNYLISSFEPKHKSQRLVKHLNYIQLSYINKCLYQSIVGPKSRYLTGICGQFYYSLIEFFAQTLRQKQFIDISGIDFVKTAVIEATNYKDLSDYKSDQLKIKVKTDDSFNDNYNQSLHLVGNSSFESICALISKREFQWNSDTIKLLSIGQTFEQNLTQNNSINATIITKENIDSSDNQMRDLYIILWNCLTNLDIKCRSIRCRAEELNRSEYSRIAIEVWLKSQNQWLTAIEISHYKEYISIRLGAPDSHIISANINIFEIIIAIIEANQTIEANIEIPECLKKFI